MTVHVQYHSMESHGFYEGLPSSNTQQDRLPEPDVNEDEQDSDAE
jgi:hypothetical protein